MPEKYIENLNKAIKHFQIADHLTYMTYPLINEEKLILKILSEIYFSLLSIINTTLQYDYLYKRIRLYTDSKSNMQTFIEKCAPRYNINKEQTNKILDIYSLMEKHKKSPLEFVKNKKVVIMSDNLQIKSIDIIQIKNYLILTKDIIRKTKEKIQTI